MLIIYDASIPPIKIRIRVGALSVGNYTSSGEIIGLYCCLYLTVYDHTLMQLIKAQPEAQYNIIYKKNYCYKDNSQYLSNTIIEADFENIRWLASLLWLSWAKEGL